MEFEAASIRTIFALGAIAWAHCTSSFSSSAQPAPAPVQALGGFFPVAYCTVKFAAGSPNVVENVLRSAAAPQASEASTMTVVCAPPLASFVAVATGHPAVFVASP